MTTETPHTHSHDLSTFNAVEHGHSHEILDGPGSYMGREMPLIEGRDWNDRAFTVGIGGYVGCRGNCLFSERVVDH